MSWLDHITKWTQSAFDKTLRNAENRDLWRTVNPWIEEY